ncbi:MAG TPA: hypothetical protein VFP76_02000 [Gemmatimonadota bacterium]|nr:hypothetical protein [Gemmatimonadota bacterium]
MASECESDRLYPVISEEKRREFVADVREHLVWDRVYRERAARRRRAAEEEGPPAKPEK